MCCDGSLRRTVPKFLHPWRSSDASLVQACLNPFFDLALPLVDSLLLDAFSCTFADFPCLLVMILLLVVAIPLSSFISCDSDTRMIHSTMLYILFESV